MLALQMTTREGQSHCQRRLKETQAIILEMTGTRIYRAVGVEVRRELSLQENCYVMDVMVVISCLGSERQDLAEAKNSVRSL